jgi:Tol biopolymer transport system component
VTIAAGTRLGPYEIVAPIGAGGMGEVYRARDTRLDRAVAIKILPTEFANDAQLKVRFEREAKTISQLNHPHICTLYDVGENYLVMELLEGETLAERLTKGPLPLEQVIRYGIEIGEGLERAHRAGIVHRDLKPSNVMITKSGAKLLDFGLAKPARPVWDTGADGLTQRKPLTEEGTIIGTIQYMAPEQLDGKDADARTDIFTLGAVLYEMITGRRAFEGKTKTSIIAAIIDRDPPPISSLQPLAPAPLDRLVRTCLAKDPDDRWQTAHDVVLELRGIRDTDAAAVPRARFDRRIHALWLLTCVVVAIIAVIGTRTLVRTARVAAPTIRASLLPPPHAAFSAVGTLAGGGATMSSGSGGVIGSFAISPDGSAITFTAVDADGRTLLWIRRLGGFTTTPLRDTDGASYPFFSPDGKFIAFFADAKLKKISVENGLPQVICDAPRPRGGSWNRDGTIIFTPTSRDPIYRVDPNGAPKPLTKLLNGEFTHRWPWFLPDGKHFLYMAEASKNGTTSYAVYGSSIDEPDRRKFLLSAASQTFYAEGYVLFSRDKVVFAQKFDPDKLQLSGEPVAIADDVQYVQATAQAIFAVSNNGVLAYQSGAAEASTRLAWLDRNGKQLATIGNPGNYGTFRLSPDATKVAISSIDPRQGTEDVWIYDLTRDVMSRVTFGPTWNSWPTWSSNGREVLFRTARTGPVDIYRKSFDGAGPEQPLVHSESIKFTGDCSPDGRSLVYYALDSRKKTKFDIHLFSLQDGRDEPFLETEFNEGEPTFSPDGHWIAYVSDETGRNEVYLTTFPASRRKVQVSTEGGQTPRWRRDGKELFFLSGDLTLNVVSVGADARTSAPKPLFKIRPSGAGALYDVAPAGDKFLVGVPANETSTATISLVVNWIAELAKS